MTSGTAAGIQLRLYRLSVRGSGVISGYGLAEAFQDKLSPARGPEDRPRGCMN